MKARMDLEHYKLYTLLIYHTYNVILHKADLVKLTIIIH